MGEAIIGVIGVVVGAFIGLITSWLTARHAERAQERVEQRQQRAQRLELLADLLLLLRRTLPFRLDGNPDRTRNLDEIFGEFRGEYAPIQRMLATLAVSDPDPDRRALAGDLAAAVGRSLTHTYLLASAIQRPPGLDDLHARTELFADGDIEAIARGSYDHALALHGQVAAAIRGQ
jgi:hypothetical protein